MIPAFNDFFHEVLGMAEDLKLQENRLSLVQLIVVLASGFADFSKLEDF
jgi:glycyl-tRNA synthetase beta subunit